MNRKIQPGLWKLYDPSRGTIWMTCWHGEAMTTFSEDFARIWIEKAQSQNVTSNETDEAYPEVADANAP